MAAFALDVCTQSQFTVSQTYLFLRNEVSSRDSDVTECIDPMNDCRIWLKHCIFILKISIATSSYYNLVPGL